MILDFHVPKVAVQLETISMTIHRVTPFIVGPPRKKTCLRGFANNKGAFAHSGQRLCFSLIGNYHTCYQRNFNFLANLCSWACWFENHFVWTPEDRFCRVEAHKMLHINFIGQDKQLFLKVQLSKFSYPSLLTYVLGAQKNGWEIRKLIIIFALFWGGLNNHFYVLFQLQMSMTRAECFRVFTLVRKMLLPTDIRCWPALRRRVPYQLHQQHFFISHHLVMSQVISSHRSVQR